jgi:hypothetical protein
VYIERKMKKREREKERETEKESATYLYKQQVFIRERRPERDPRPSEWHSERGRGMSLL